MKNLAIRILMLLAVALPTAVGTLFIGTMSGCAITPVEKGQNVALVNTERAQVAAVGTLKEFWKFDHRNAEWLTRNAPLVRQVADRTRQQAPDIIREVRRLTVEYKADVAAGRRPADGPLQEAIDKLEALAADAAKAQAGVQR
ncbi:MAG TPA: hypothetical protein VGN72_06530 [Tepidisphaeraceae bacterium]|jgi:hypothetical protein|nr:hypothetical protein [Tepidisphaeraceae bacterium]